MEGLFIVGCLLILSCASITTYTLLRYHSSTENKIATISISLVVGSVVSIVVAFCTSLLTHPEQVAGWCFFFSSFVFFLFLLIQEFSYRFHVKLSLVWWFVALALLRCALAII